MEIKEVTYANPIDCINETLKEVGYLKGIYNNPLSILIHIFYSFGNGYRYTEEGGTTTILHEKFTFSHGETEKDAMPDMFKETKGQYDTLMKHYKSEHYEQMLKDIHSTNEKFEELLGAIKGQLDALKETFDEKWLELEELKTLEDLEKAEIDPENKYWENIVWITSHHSMAANIPENLSTEWKKAFKILSEKMEKADPEKFQMVQKKIEMQKTTITPNI